MHLLAEKKIVSFCMKSMMKANMPINYRVIKEFENYSLIKLWLETGEHQTRVSYTLSVIRVGDDLYGGKLNLISAMLLMLIN